MGPENFIVEVQHALSDEARITYNKPQSSAVFAVGDFTSQPSGETSIAYSQPNETDVLVQFTGDVSADTDVDYAGTAVNVKTPDDNAYT